MSSLIIPIFYMKLSTNQRKEEDNTMQILSWNLNGLKACIKRNDFEQLRKLPPLDVLCFQETRTQEKPIVFKDYHHYWYPAEAKKYSGTLTLSLVKPLNVIYGIGVPELDKEGRVLTIDLGSVYVVNTYVPNSQGGPDREDYRRDWDVAYHNFLFGLASEKPVIACGDFNVTMARIDVYEENMRIDWAEQGYISDERSNLQSLLDDGFTDAYRFLYPEEKNAFTWWSNRRYKRNEDRGWRLDYFIVSNVLQPQIRNVIHHQEITGSDHCPIVLDCAVEDTDYASKYSSALAKKEANENEERRLAQLWNNRQRQFEKYEKKLASIQAEISLYTLLRDNGEVLKRQIRIMDDIRFKCLAVNKVAKASAPPGVDDVKWKTNADKMRAALDLEWRNYKASPKRIIEIKSKNTGKVRRTGILTYRDKAMSILCGYTFSPVEEAYADRSSFAFRPGRSRQDAIVAASYLFNGNDAPLYYVYADIRGFYAALQHKWIMQHVPIVKDVLHAFLKAGHIFDGELFPSGDAGISEGSPLSPSIANFTLDGLQKAIYNGLHGRYSDIDYPNGAMVRYADDVIVAVRSMEDAKIVVATIRKFLEPRGLVLSEEKTKTGNILDEIELIGFSMKKETYGVALIRRSLIPHQHHVRCFLHGFRALQHDQHRRITVVQFLPQEAQLHGEIPDGNAPIPCKIQKCLLPAPKRPLANPVSCLIRCKIRICTIIHQPRIVFIRYVQFPVVGILKICGNQTAFRVHVSHHPCNAIRIPDLIRQVIPDKLLRIPNRYVSRRLCSPSQSPCHLQSQITHPRIHPVTRAALVRKPPVNRQDHFIFLWLIR